MEYATYKGPRKAAAFQQAHTANAVRHELELLTSSAQRIMDYARTQQQRSRLDGRKVIEDRKRERRKIIGQVGRYGIGQL